VDDRVAFFMVGEVARLTLAVVFAMAAYHAMREWTVFGGIIEQYHVVPRWLAQLAAWILPPLEYLTAVCLVLPATGRVGAVLGLVLMTPFTLSIVVNLARGRVLIDCGCGGAGGQKLSRGLVVRNLLLMLGLVVAWAAPQRGLLDSATVIGLIGAPLALTALYFAANQLMTNIQLSRALGSRGLS
jgi:hypothetical protein